jgi:fucose permease
MQTSLSKITPGKWANTAGYYAAFLSFGLVIAALGPALSGLAAHTQTDLSQISMLFTARSLGFLLGAWLGGRIFDRLAGHPVLVSLLLVMGLATALTPVQPRLWLLILLMLILGISVGIMEVGSNTLLVLIHRHNLDPWMNGLHFFFGVGAFLSPIIMTQVLAATGDITWGFWILALLALLPAGWLVRLPGPANKDSATNGQGGRLNYRLVIPLALLFLLYVGAEAGLGGWIYTFTTTLHPGAETTAGYLTAAFWGSLTIGRLLAIPLSTRLRPRLMLGLDFTGCLFSISPLLLWPASLAAVWVSTVGAGLFMASIFPTLLTFAERRMQISGRASSYFFVASGLGGMTIPWFIGQVFETLGPASTMVTISLDLLLALVIFVGLAALAPAEVKPY